MSGRALSLLPPAPSERERFLDVLVELHDAIVLSALDHPLSPRTRELLHAVEKHLRKHRRMT